MALPAKKSILVLFLLAILLAFRLLERPKIRMQVNFTPLNDIWARHTLVRLARCIEFVAVERIAKPHALMAIGHFSADGEDNPRNVKVKPVYFTHRIERVGLMGHLRCVYVNDEHTKWWVDNVLKPYLLT